MAFRNIMLYGGGGSNIGHHILQALAADSTFCTTVLARESSKTVFPALIRVVKVPDNFPRAELVGAMAGQDVVICAPQENQEKMLEAALEAMVPRFYPSEWGMDNADPKNQEMSPVFKSKAKMAYYLQSKESATFSWTAIATSIWLDWALDNIFIGIDPFAHKVEYWQNGTHTAQAVIASLKHPEATRNQRIFVSPFEVSQRKIVEVLEELQGVKYDVTHIPGDIMERTNARIVGGDTNAVAVTIAAGVLLSEYRADFVSSGKTPLIESVDSCLCLRGKWMPKAANLSQQYLELTAARFRSYEHQFNHHLNQQVMSPACAH
ncbi:hypothetical protein LTR56_011542 [Elasticomyces elasticus]|nr:hypothetical protein LTR56_011542 [Elasticomyces elasticus]KAK3643271.1 hypothetical protein LTR22_015738 [Elasticomyces elasticus]KAK4930261.1 hypothetical protein LTR49_003295 [Elasticomyces elasticus]KAK5763169.1 hypothetical protein LTS12_006758 [Elasticomyces elasticus]